MTKVIPSSSITFYNSFITKRASKYFVFLSFLLLTETGKKIGKSRYRIQITLASPAHIYLRGDTTDIHEYFVAPVRHHKVSFDLSVKEDAGVELVPHLIKHRLLHGQILITTFAGHVLRHSRLNLSNTTQIDTKM